MDESPSYTQHACTYINITITGNKITSTAKVVMKRRQDIGRGYLDWIIHATSNAETKPSVTLHKVELMQHLQHKQPDNGNSQINT
jgi:hypothetical protein